MTYTGIKYDPSFKDEYPKFKVKDKELSIRPFRSMWEVHWVGGGEVPSVLSGMYTRKEIAIRDIQTFIKNKQEVKEDKKTK